MVMVSDRVLLLPTLTLPKAMLAGLGESVPAVTAVPDTGTVRVAFEASLVTVRLPLGLPDDCGVKTTLNDLLAPAARVNGTVTPLTLNPEPVTATCETFTVVPPELVIVSDKLWVLPTVTVPKLKLGVPAVSDPAVTAVPDNGTVRLVFEALLVIVSVPLGVPAACGVKITLKLLLAPAAKVSGTVRPLRLNPVPETLACVMFTDDPPELVKVSERLWLLPTVTVPNVRLGAPATIVPAVTAVPDTGTVRLGFDASLVTVSIPLGVPADCGAKATLKDLLAPAARVNGRVTPLTL